MKKAEVKGTCRTQKKIAQKEAVKSERERIQRIMNRKGERGQRSGCYPGEEVQNVVKDSNNGSLTLRPGGRWRQAKIFLDRSQAPRKQRGWVKGGSKEKHER